MKEFMKLLSVLKDGMKFTLRKEDCVDGDRFLIFSNYRPFQTITLHTNCVPFWVEFDGDEPMRLEECPETFFATLRKNIECGNYELLKK